MTPYEPAAFAYGGMRSPLPAARSNDPSRPHRVHPFQSSPPCQLSEIAREVEGAPEELRETLTGMDSAAAVRQRHRLAAREAVEEDLMLRVPLSREEGKAQRAARRAGLAGAALLDDFREDVASVLEGGLGGDFQRHRTGQRWGGDASAAGAARPRSGDADLPAREPLAKRRAAFDSVAAKKAQRTSGEKSAGGELARTEDEFYASVKASKGEGVRELVLGGPGCKHCTGAIILGRREVAFATGDGLVCTPGVEEDVMSPSQSSHHL